MNPARPMVGAQKCLFFFFFPGSSDSDHDNGWDYYTGGLTVFPGPGCPDSTCGVHLSGHSGVLGTQAYCFCLGHSLDARMLLNSPTLEPVTLNLGVLKVT